MNAFVESALLVFVLLNPFIMSVYLLELVKGLESRAFSIQLFRAGIISFVVFALFALTGDVIFETVFQIHFSSFLIFGGITFLIIGIRLILGASAPSETLHPASGQISASIAMPFIVGPGTISASVLAGSRLPPMAALAAIGIALVAALVAIIGFKGLHDYVQRHNEKLIHRYVEVAGRVTALFTGSFAIEMILRGIDGWLASR